MNEDEKEVLKVGAEAAMKPFADLMQKLFGGAVAEIGGAWEDSLATRRKVRQIRLFKKLQAEIDKAGFEPRQVPDNIWVPALTEALQQDEETLQTKWAKVLVTAADPKKEMIPASFPKILAELSASEVLFLDCLYERLSAEAGTRDAHKGRMTFTKPLKYGYLEKAHAEADVSEDLDMAVDNIMRLGILRFEPPVLDRDEFLRGEGPNEGDGFYRITTLGYSFLNTCHGPE